MKEKEKFFEDKFINEKGEKDENIVIMKCNEKNLSFQKKNYPSILEHCIAKWEWDLIADEANCVIGNAYHLRKLEENVEIPEYMNVSFWILFIFSLIGFIFLIIYTQFEKFNEIAVYIVLGLTIICSCIIIALMIYNYFRKLKDEKTIDEFIIEGMDEYMKILNKNFKNIVFFRYNHENLEIELTLLKKTRL